MKWAHLENRENKGKEQQTKNGLMSGENNFNVFNNSINQHSYLMSGENNLGDNKTQGGILIKIHESGTIVPRKECDLAAKCLIYSTNG